MQKVFVKVMLDMIDTSIHFFTKLRAFVGEFTIEGTDYANGNNDVIIISFYTDKLNIPEGKSRQVELIATFNNDGWDFSELKSFYA